MNYKLLKESIKNSNYPYREFANVTQKTESGLRRSIDNQTLTVFSLEKTLMIYFDYALNKNTLLKDLRNHGWNVRGVKQKKIKAPKFDELLHNEDFLDILENKEYQKFDTPVEIPV